MQNIEWTNSQNHRNSVENIVTTLCAEVLRTAPVTLNVLKHGKHYDSAE